MAHSSLEKGLSKNLLQMKFMRKSAVKRDLDETNRDISQIIDDEHWVLDLPEVSAVSKGFVYEPSDAVCNDLLFGRMSFKGFNPEIEKLMAENKKEKELEKAEENERLNSVDDKEMAERYTSLVSTIGQKFKKKKKRIKEEVVEQIDSDVVEEEEEEEEEVPVRKKHKKQKPKFLKPKE